MQFEFGTGTFYAAPQTGAPSLTPVPFGTSQDVTLDISFTTKQLFGQLQFPAAIGRGEAKISGKCKAANFSAAAFNGIFMGQAVVNTGLLVANAENHTIPGTPYQITVTNAATFLDDLGVTYAATGNFLAKVISAPATGQYSVNTATGIYTFAAADTTLGVNISYTYTAASGYFRTIVTNQPMGAAPLFTAVLSNTYLTPGLATQTFTLKLFACIASKLSMGFKNTDFVVPEFDFEAMVNLAGQVLDLTISSN